jgi:hypothetical protein
MFQLVADIPTPILAEILGLGRNTAVRWCRFMGAGLAGLDYANGVRVDSQVSSSCFG